MELWEGKVAVVTGASSGIGKQVALKLAQSGMKVAAIARRENKLLELASSFQGKGEILAYKCDVTDQLQVASVFSKIEKDHGHIRVLVNSAGVFSFTKFSDMAIDDWREMLEVHLFGTFICIKYMLKSINKNDEETSHIINVNTAVPLNSTESLDSIPYFVTKLPADMLTKGLVRQVATEKINVKITSLNPGMVRTELVLQCPEEFKEYIDNSPFLEPLEVAESVEMILTSPKNAVISELTIRPVGEAGY